MTNMFRGKANSKIDIDHFGVGSVIVYSKEYWLVVASPDNKSISVLHLNTFMLSSNRVVVEDINFISQDEAREICKLADPDNAFSDFTLNPAGLKDHNMKFEY